MSEEQEAFEAWYDSEPEHLSTFSDCEKDAAWRGAQWQAARQSAGATGQEPVGTLSIHRFRKIDSMVNHDFEYYGSLPDGTYRVYAAPIGDNGAKDCIVDKYVSRMCEYGTKGCTTEHEQPAESKRAAWVALTDDDRKAAFESLPDMLDGFLKTWGWLHFAKEIERRCKEKNAHVESKRVELSEAQRSALNRAMGDAKIAGRLDDLFTLSTLLARAQAGSKEGA